MSAAFRCVLLLLLLLQLAGCSSTTFLYNRLDFLLPWYLHSYVDLNREQNRYLDQLLAPYLLQHRRQHLPRYVAIIDRALTLLEQDRIEAADVTALYEQASAEADGLQAEMQEMLLLIAAELSDRQIEEFIRELRQRQEKYEKKYLRRDNERYRRDVYDDLLDSIEDYLGRLDPEQRQQLKFTSERLQRWDVHWLQERRQWVDSLQQLLSRQPHWQQQIREVQALRYSHASAQYREAFEQNLVLLHGSLAQLLSSRNEKQERRLRRKLQNLREDLLTLIQQGGDLTKNRTALLKGKTLAFYRL